MKRTIILAAGLLLLIIQYVSGQNDAVYNDVHGYKTAAEMYVVADTLPFDKTADNLIRQIDQALNNQINIENQKVWDNLVRLEPYRKTPQVQDAVKRWAIAYQNCRNNYSGSHVSYFDCIAQYMSGQFDKMIEVYRVQYFNITGKDNSESKTYKETRSYDRTSEFAVRNNMALALMHSNLDLCAQIELEIIASANDSIGAIYVPGMINLTVVYERLGFSDKAKELALRLHDYEDLDPMTNFNAAWYLDPSKDGNRMFDLQAFKNMPDEKYRLMERKAKQNMPWFGIGLLRSFGYHFDINMTLIYLIFFIISLLLWYGYYRVLVKRYRRLPRAELSDSGGCLIGLVIGGPLILLFIFDSAGPLILIFFLIIAIIWFYPILINLLLSFILYVLLMGGSNVWEPAGIILYMMSSLIASIIIAVCAHYNSD